MFSTLLSATFIFAAAAIQGVSADFAISTPSLVQCETAHVSWAKAAAPYNLAVVHSNDPCGDVLLDLGDHNGTTMSWVVNLPVGTQVMFSLLDNGDDEAWSGNMTVTAGNNTSCLSGSSATTDVVSATLATGTTDVAAATGAASGTTLVVDNVPSATTGADGVATPVGAANAGELGNSSGALSSAVLSRSTAIFGSAVAIFAAMML
ncbi:hypothetical protein SCHPADRAFT_853446 [Schizopora paradoxa]|uniref:Uncharacterized protein n=1 Tax=Schizopora paradoxa TaxID=27342 RepID=A0A0H2RLH6_9AGAM|nr:hypothetical protein SCHPADRAFT_853446 [Schizopora paradoxa]